MDLENCEFPKGIALVYDSKRCPQAFKVYATMALVFYSLTKLREMPPLVPIQKKINTIISSEKVVNGYTIGSVKRPHTLRHELTINTLDFRDHIFWIGCGLHNLSTRHRTKT